MQVRLFQIGTSKAFTANVSDNPEFEIHSLVIEEQVETTASTSEPSTSVSLPKTPQHLAKAFDTVSHAILLEVLERYGVRGTVLSVFSSYLEERIQHVRIADTVSSPGLVRHGVPQGTVVGPPPV